MKPLKLYLWNLWHWRDYSSCRKCDGFDCTIHCCPKRCWIYKDQRVCPDRETYDQCPFMFKDRLMG